MPHGMRIETTEDDCRIPEMDGDGVGSGGGGWRDLYLLLPDAECLGLAAPRTSIS
jgi:hypothetical protein